MVVSPTIEGMASALSLVLAALASLRAASRLEQRMCNNGSIGLMDGPPILGPSVRHRHDEVGVIDRHGNQSPLLDDGDRIEGNNEVDDTQFIEASPLWEHTEAFRRAVILGLILEDNTESVSNSIFSDICVNERESINIRGGSVEDLAIAAAVEAGLLLPSATFGGSGARHRVRGGETTATSYRKMKGKYGDNNSTNPFSIMSSWLIRELSAPLAAVPAWHGLICSYLREQRANKPRESRWCSLTPWERSRFYLTGRSGGKAYDPAGLDFRASTSAAARIPSAANDAGRSPPASKEVRLKAFAPKTFRDLRNNCFRMTEAEYARSVLNAINGDNLMNDIGEGDAGAPMAYADTNAGNDDSSISHILREILRGERRTKGGIRSGVRTLPYVSFQSNSKGAARAGTFFFFTADGAFMVKTVKKEEANAFLEMLPEYHRFMSDGVNARNSLLTRICGMYSVRFPSDADARSPEGDRWDGGLYPSGRGRASGPADDERVYLVMHSVFPPDASAFVTERFDLKGSTAGRECSPEERRAGGANAVLKDLDLKREVAAEMDGVDEGASGGRNGRKRPRHGICVGNRRKAALMAQLGRDVDLLRRCNVLDYSLLVGVADMEQSGGAAESKARGDRRPERVRSLFRWMDSPMPYYGAGTTGVDGGALSALRGSRKGKRVIYYLGVIDFLQPWTVKKRLERDLKGLAGFDKSAISCAAPADYAGRFLAFVDSHVT